MDVQWLGSVLVVTVWLSRDRARVYRWDNGLAVPPKVIRWSRPRRLANGNGKAHG